MFKLNPRLEPVYRRLPSGIRDGAASVYGWWSARKKYGGGFPAWSRFLAESQWWDARRMEAYQAEQLERLFRLADSASPFYRENFQRHGVRPGDSDPFASLRRLPIIDRAVVRGHYDGIRTRLEEDARLTLSTSGTTGASLHVPHTLDALQREYAFRWQFYSVAGAQRGDRFALFQGQMVVPLSHRHPPFHIRNYAENTIMFSLYHMAENTLGDYVRALNRFAPDFVYGYPSGIFLLAQYAQAAGLRIRPVRAVFTASEMLHDFQQEVIRAVFGAQIFQWYGQVETTVNLHECDRHRLHVKEEYGFLELLAEDGTPPKPGQPGRVIATGWGNSAFPLLRYHTGDNMVLAADQSCPCGRAGRIIERIAGRDDDFVVTPEGCHVGRLDFVFKAVDSVEESQIIQEDLHHITLLVVPRKDYSERDEQVIVQKLKERIGDSIRITVQRTDRIPRSGGGKFRYVVSKVKTPITPP